MKLTKSEKEIILRAVNRKPQCIKLRPMFPDYVEGVELELQNLYNIVAWQQKQINALISVALERGDFLPSNQQSEARCEYESSTPFVQYGELTSYESI